MEKFWPFVQRHWFLSLAFVVVFILILLYEKRSQGGVLGGISPQAAVKLINHEKAQVFDLRPEASFSRGHIVNSTQVSLADLAARLQKTMKRKNKPIVLVGEPAMLVTARKQLEKSGFEKVYTINGGLKAWQDAKLPLEKL